MPRSIVLLTVYISTSYFTHISLYPVLTIHTTHVSFSAIANNEASWPVRPNHESASSQN